MNIILLSGGSGKRLWPLSNDVRSKQFIKIFKTGEGVYSSMVQRVYQQIRSVDKDAVITIATAKSQVSSICNQLGSPVNICVPGGRRCDPRKRQAVLWPGRQGCRCHCPEREHAVYPDAVYAAPGAEETVG